MIDIIRLGEMVVVYGTLLKDDVPIDPISLRLEIEDPSGSITEYIWNTDPEIVRDSIGAFHFDLMATQPGRWIYRWFSNSTLTAFEIGNIDVAHSVIIQSTDDMNPSNAIAFVSIRIWDGDGNSVNFETKEDYTDSTGLLTTNLPAGTYRITAFKTNWIYEPFYFDVIASPTVIRLIGRSVQTSWLHWEDLEMVTDKETVDKLFTDKNTAMRDMVMLEDVLQQAETIAESQMLRSWTQSQIVDLARADKGLRSQAAWLAIEFATERRHEFISADGRGRYWAQYERSMSFFKELSKSQIHSRGEVSAGKGANAGGAVRPILQVNQARRIFADEPDGSSHGGF